MKTLINLTKIYLKDSIVNFIGKSKNSKIKSSTLFLVLFAIIGIALGFEYYTMAQTFAPLGLSQCILPIGLITCTIILIFTNTKSFGEIFYKSNDYEMLSSLPIKNSLIILSKYFGSMGIAFIFACCTLLPTFVVYFIFNQITVIKVIYCILGLLLIPAFSQFVGCIISWLSNTISSKVRNKNLFSGIFNLIFVLGLLVAITSLSSEAMAMIFVNDFPLWIKITLPFIYFLNQAIIYSNFLYFIAFIGVCILYIFASVGIIAVGYKKINSNLKTSIKNKINKPLTYRKKSTFIHLIIKEAKTFFSTPPYFINVIIGPILALVLPFGLLGMSDLLLTINSNIPAIFTALLAPAVIGMAPASASAISAEGKNFKNIKALPISHSAFLWSKVAFNFILNMPFLLVSQLISIIIFKLSFITSIIVITIGFTLLFFISLTSLFFNLLLPNLDWTSIVHIVKQSASVVISMFVNMVITIIPFVLALTIIPASFNINLYLVIVLASIVLINIIITILFVTKSKNLYNKLS